MFYTSESKNTIIEQHTVQMKPVSQLSSAHSIPRSTIYTWIKEYKDAEQANTQ